MMVTTQVNAPLKCKFLTVMCFGNYAGLTNINIENEEAIKLREE